MRYNMASFISYLLCVLYVSIAFCDAQSINSSLQDQLEESRLASLKDRLKNLQQEFSQYRSDSNTQLMMLRQAVEQRLAAVQNLSNKRKCQLRKDSLNKLWYNSTLTQIRNSVRKSTEQSLQDKFSFCRCKSTTINTPGSVVFSTTVRSIGRQRTSTPANHSTGTTVSFPPKALTTQARVTTPQVQTTAAYDLSTPKEPTTPGVKEKTTTTGSLPTRLKLFTSEVQTTLVSTNPTTTTVPATSRDVTTRVALKKSSDLYTAVERSSPKISASTPSADIAKDISTLAPQTNSNTTTLTYPFTSKHTSTNIVYTTTAAPNTTFVQTSKKVTVTTTRKETSPTQPPTLSTTAANVKGRKTSMTLKAEIISSVLSNPSLKISWKVKKAKNVMLDHLECNIFANAMPIMVKTFPGNTRSSSVFLKHWSPIFKYSVKCDARDGTENIIATASSRVTHAENQGLSWRDIQVGWQKPTRTQSWGWGTLTGAQGLSWRDLQDAYNGGSNQQSSDLDNFAIGSWETGFIGKR